MVLLLLLLAFSGYQYGATTPHQSDSASLVSAVCPWLTPGSAARLLGGDVSATVTISTLTEGSCRFARRDQPMDSLEILVGGGALPPCPANSVSLTGIGNEAATCKLPASHGEMGEMVSGRVRDVHFTLVLREQKRSAKPSEDQGDPLEPIAEQVAGNLF